MGKAGDTPWTGHALFTLTTGNLESSADLITYFWTVGGNINAWNKHFNQVKSLYNQAECGAVTVVNTAKTIEKPQSSL